MCKVFKVSKSGYYNWIKQGSKISKEDKELNDLIMDIFIASRKTYGTIRIKKSLLEEHGVIVSRRKISKIMRSLGLKSVYFKRNRQNTTDSNHNEAISENRLEQNFKVDKPDTVYVGDITYIQTKKGMVYLATVIDLFSRKIVGYAVDDNMKTTLINKALQMAIDKRKPSKNTIFHSDRGSQYASKSFRNLLLDNKFLQSMSKKGDCFDNAVAESCFKSIKTELVYQKSFKDLDDVKLEVFYYIQGFYNTKRLHSFCDYQSPVKFENEYYKNSKLAA
jgi:transposase InsO family protein